jgi:hypothetical protein
LKYYENKKLEEYKTKNNNNGEGFEYKYLNMKFEDFRNILI